MKIVAVIVTYNAMKWVDRCMQSLRDSFIPVETVVVDNGSTDGTRDYLPAHYPEVIFLPQDENLGFGQANNVGLRFALENNADYALLLNQDAWIDAQMLVQLIRFSDGKSVLSPIQLNGQGTDFDRNFNRNTISRSSDILSLMELKNGHKTRPFFAEAAAAACWLIPIEIIRSVGGFNPLFFQYGEDHNYLDRVFFHGYQLEVVPTAFMCHDRNQYGNAQLYQHKIVYRYLLLYATDIRQQPSFRHLLRICGYWCREGLRNHRLLKMIGQSISGLFLLWKNKAAILESRNEEQIPGSTWL